jgi:hypothetical protein
MSSGNIDDTCNMLALVHNLIVSENLLNYSDRLTLLIHRNMTKKGWSPLPEKQAKYNFSSLLSEVFLGTELGRESMIFFGGHLT